MQRQRGQTVRKKIFSVGQVRCLFIIFHMLMVGYAVLFLHPFYGSNDEFTLAAIASGAYGDYTQYFIYIYSGFGWILKLFYSLVPDVNWYTIVMYGIIFLSLTSVGWVFIGRSKRTGAMLSVMMVMACTQPLYVEFQYTKTAAVSVAAGYVLLFSLPDYRKGVSGSGETPGGRTGIRAVAGAVLGGILLILGCWIRFHAFGMVSLMAFGMWLYHVRDAWKSREWKQLFLWDCLPCILVFSVIVGSILLENALVYRPGSAEAHYREYDRARQQLLDYGVPEWDEYEAEYKALGLTRTDCINFHNWLIADYDRYTADTFRAVVAFRRDDPFQWEYLADYLWILVKKPLFLMGVLVTLLWMWPLSEIRKKNWIGVVYPYGALLGIYLYFIKIYRVLPIVVTACLISFMIFVWWAAGEEIGRQWDEKLNEKLFPAAGLAGVALTFLICIRMLAAPVFQVPLQDSEPSVAYRTLYDTISKKKEIYFAFDPLTNNGVEFGYSIFEKIPEDYLVNVFTLGGWETESPQVVSNLERYGARSLLTSLYRSDRAVLISNSLMEHIMLHLQDTYDGIFITYSKVNQIGNFDLFALNYKMSGLKDTEEFTAVLDRTYTAENERYDVFEGTVHMTPEELEGKSVFLWMQSVESGKRRMYQGTWQQQDEDGLYTMIYDQELADTDQVRFMIPKLSYPLDDRYEVHIVIRDGDKGKKILTENHLYEL